MRLDFKLRQWQQDLIDMSHNNNLLYFHTEGKRRSGIELRFDNPDQVFVDLRRERKKIVLNEHVVFLGSEAEPDLWERRLTRLRTQARDDLNNRGINTLYVAFGLLKWKESPASEEIIRSPLLLVPVALDRAGALGAFSLQRWRARRRKSTRHCDINFNMILGLNCRSSPCLRTNSKAPVRRKMRPNRQGVRSQRSTRRLRNWNGV